MKNESQAGDPVEHDGEQEQSKDWGSANLSLDDGGEARRRDALAAVLQTNWAKHQVAEEIISAAKIFETYLRDGAVN